MFTIVLHSLTEYNSQSQQEPLTDLSQAGLWHSPTDSNQGVSHNSTTGLQEFPDHSY